MAKRTLGVLSRQAAVPRLDRLNRHCEPRAEPSPLCSPGGAEPLPPGGDCFLNRSAQGGPGLLGHPCPGTAAQAHHPSHPFQLQGQSKERQVLVEPLHSQLPAARSLALYLLPGSVATSATSSCQTAACRVEGRGWPEASQAE